MARISVYERRNGRCPACEFLKGLDRQIGKKFSGSFLGLMNIGGKYHVDQRFKALGGKGKPLWEFKEHGHRLYCHRYVVHDTDFVQIVLFNGWDKQKEGRTDKEVREIQKAKDLYQEFLAEYPGGTI